MSKFAGLRFTLAIVAFSFGAAGFAIAPRSSNYIFEYVAVGMGGGVSSSGSYDLTAYADESGSANMARSTNYSVEPVVGAPDTADGSSAVNNWDVYQ